MSTPRGEYYRKWAQANPEKIAKYRERQRAWRAANRDRINAQQRGRRSDDTRAYMRDYRARTIHGPDHASVWATMWNEQDGKCYLCGIYLDSKLAFIDHDHRCDKVHSCASCRRGIACPSCNSLIGYANDDPVLLRRIADNLEVKLAEIDRRLAAKWQQSTIDQAEAG